MKIPGVTDTIIEHLRMNIITGGLKPRTKLTEAELCKQFNVSRAPIREAMRTLECFNLVTRYDRKGIHVSSLSIENLREIFQARKMVERYCIDIFAEKNVVDIPGVDENLKAVVKMNFDLNQTTDIDHDYQYFKMLNTFHALLIRATGNSFIINFYELIRSHLSRYQYYVLMKRSAKERIQKMSEHKEIYLEIKKGSYEASKNLITSHIDDDFQYLEENLHSEF